MIMVSDPMVPAQSEMIYRWTGATRFINQLVVRVDESVDMARKTCAPSIIPTTLGEASAIGHQDKPDRGKLKPESCLCKRQCSVKSQLKTRISI